MTRRHSRRNILKATLASLAIPSLALAKSEIPKSLKLGVIADLHGGLAVDARSRLESFLQSMEQEQCDALVQMGDFAYPNAKHQVFPDTFNAAHDSTLHVIGNHEFDFGLKRADCYSAWGIESSYYRKDLGGIRMLVLDGNERGSPSHGGGYPSFIGPEQVEWLEQELTRSNIPILIFSHQPLAGTAAIDNASEVQQLIGRFKSKVVLCLNGHSHVDSLVRVDDVPYLHVNSASYYWVGGKTRMAYYAEPLYSTLTIDPQSATVTVAPKASRWKNKSPKEIGYFDRPNAPPEEIVTPQIRERRIGS